MSGIYIPNVEKENSCFDCPIWSLCWDDKISEDIRKYKRCPAIPAADVQEVRHGRWVADKEDIEWGNHLIRYRCSECKERPHFDKDKNKFVLSPYCPNCGAKMDESEDEE